MDPLVDNLPRILSLIHRNDEISSSGLEELGYDRSLSGTILLLLKRDGLVETHAKKLGEKTVAHFYCLTERGRRMREEYMSMAEKYMGSTLNSLKL